MKPVRFKMASYIGSTVHSDFSPPDQVFGLSYSLRVEFFPILFECLEYYEES